MRDGNVAPLAITIGDPGGIGPEIVVKALAEDPALADGCLVVGDRRWLEHTAQALGLPCPPHIDSPGEGWPQPWGKALLPPDLPVGRVNAVAGEAAYQYVLRGIDHTQRRRCRALVTAPISKEALHLAGHDYPGHTELLAERAGGVPVRMMLINDELRAVLVTIHLSLRDAIDQITSANVLQTIELADAALRGAGIVAPRLAVAGLNPHAGEAGRFGREEIDVIAPAIVAARAKRIDASGPHAPDTVFMRARGFREFDAVIAMYHDQGLIPVKYLGLDQGVNITIGLPFVRTSPDHGTAFDLAGRGRADPASLKAAIRQAHRLTSLSPGSLPASP